MAQEIYSVIIGDNPDTPMLPSQWIVEMKDVKTICPVCRATYTTTIPLKRHNELAKNNVLIPCCSCYSKLHQEKMLSEIEGGYKRAKEAISRELKPLLHNLLSLELLHDFRRRIYNICKSTISCDFICYIPLLNILEFPQKILKKIQSSYRDECFRDQKFHIIITFNNSRQVITVLVELET